MRVIFEKDSIQDDMHALLDEQPLLAAAPLSRRSNRDLQRGSNTVAVPVVVVVVKRHPSRPDHLGPGI